MTTDTQTPPSDQVTLGDKSVELSTFDRYKGTKGRTDRIALLSSTLTKGLRYYIKPSGPSFRAPTNPEVLALCKKNLGEPEQRFGLIVFHYLTDEGGNLIDLEKCQGKVKIWSISESRYEELSNLHRQWPLLANDAVGFAAPQFDMTFACKDEQYQRGAFTPTPTAHWKQKQKWYDVLLEKRAKAATRIPATFGRTLSDLEIMEKLGVSMPNQTGSTDNANDIDLSDVMGD